MGFNKDAITPALILRGKLGSGNGELYRGQGIDAAFIAPCS